MASGVRLNAPGVLWTAIAAVLAGGSLLAWWAPAAWLDWQPAHAGELWRWWTAAFVHWSPWHLAANLMGTMLVAALGRVGGATPAAALAWLAAWPLTHGLLLMQPALAHYGGLSGVLHAGVAVAATGLVRREHGRRRWIGAAILAGLLVKLLLERPWGAALVQPADWDIAVAPLAHATGSAAGVLCALAADAVPRRAVRIGR